MPAPACGLLDAHIDGLDIIRDYQVAYTCPGFADSSAPIWAFRMRGRPNTTTTSHVHVVSRRIPPPALVPLPTPTIRDSIAFLTNPLVLVGRRWLGVNHTNRIVETAKENGLIPFEYLRYLFERLPNLGDGDLDELLPWSPSLPDTCRARKDG